MDFLKELFGSEALTYDQLAEKVSAKGLKVADLSTGNYVARKKYDDDVASRDTQITGLTEQLTTRDGDIKSLKKQLEDGGKDNETKVTELTAQLTKLQGEYKTAKTDYETKLSKQSYEFAVKNFANGQQFSSKAAKTTFINDMLSAQLTMNNDEIIGANDFLTKYKTENADSFVAEKKEEPTPQAGNPKPTFVQPTPPASGGPENPFDTFFNFHGVR